MKKILHTLVVPFVGGSVLLLSSCGAQQTYPDGIYGEEPVREYSSKEKTTSKPPAQSYSYRKYLNEKAAEHNAAAQQLAPKESYTPLTDTQSYHTPSQENQYHSYNSWGQNTPTQVNIYNNYPTSSHTYSYWGVQRPAYYDGYYSSFHYPYSGLQWSVGVGSWWGYEQHYYPRHYWYYYDSPYAYRYYSPYPRSYYYGNGGDGYYGGRNDSYPRKSYTPNTRRGDASRYNQTTPSYGQGTTNRSYGQGDGSSRVYRPSNSSQRTPQPRYERESSSSTNQSNSSRGHSSDSSSRSYTPPSSGSSSGSGAGTTRRGY